MPEGIHRDMADMKKILIGAHRGAMCHAPENSLAAFEKAIDFGTYRIECDIRQTNENLDLFQLCPWRLKHSSQAYF